MFIMLYLFVRHVATLKQYWAIICALKIREKKKKRLYLQPSFSSRK